MKASRIINIIYDKIDGIFLVLVFLAIMFFFGLMGVKVEYNNETITKDFISTWLNVFFNLFLGYLCVRVGLWYFLRDDTETISLDEIGIEMTLNYHPEDLIG